MVSPKRRDPRRTGGVSLTYELATIRRSVEAARRTLDDAEVADESSVRARRREAAAVLAVSAARLRLLGSMVRGEVDAGLLLEPHNASPCAADDVVILPRRVHALRRRAE
jgi:hypothetical protein